MSEKVNHPPHYQREGRKECIEEMRDKYGDCITYIFCLTNAYKYLYRAGEKEGNSEVQDIAKAKWYMEYAARKLEKPMKNKKTLEQLSEIIDGINSISNDMVNAYLISTLKQSHITKDDINKKNIDLWGDALK